MCHHSGEVGSIHNDRLSCDKPVALCEGDGMLQ